MDGFATCSAMMDRHADLPVIFMTGLGETRHIVRLRGRGLRLRDQAGGDRRGGGARALARRQARLARSARSRAGQRGADAQRPGPMAACCGPTPAPRRCWGRTAGPRQPPGRHCRPPGARPSSAGGAAAQDGQAGADGGDRVDGLGGLRLRRLTGAGTTVVVVELSRGENRRPALTAREAEVMISSRAARPTVTWRRSSA